MGKLANKRQHKNENIMDSSDEKTKVSETHHCIGFDMPTANEAFNHFAGHLVVLEKYGDMCNEHTLHTWDDGYRELCQCTACGGLFYINAANITDWKTMTSTATFSLLTHLKRRNN